MKNNLKTAILFVIVIIIILAGCVWYLNLGPSANADNIMVEAVLEPNHTGISDYKEYLLNIKLKKEKDCHVAVYPYIEGLGLMSFNDLDRDKYFVPGAIGSDGVTEPIAIKALEEQNIVEDGHVDSLVGFWFPDEAGQYEARIYLDKLEGSNKIKDPVLVLVYYEIRFGKKISWSKIVPITEITDA